MRFFKWPLTPRSEIGRVIVAVLIAVFATIALLEWSPASPSDTDPPKARRAAVRAGGGFP
jgi:hypothetical protein